MAKTVTFEMAANYLESVNSVLPETISLDDVRHHPHLRRLVLAADDLANRIDRRALEWAKSQ